MTRDLDLEAALHDLAAGAAAAHQDDARGGSPFTVPVTRRVRRNRRVRGAALAGGSLAVVAGLVAGGLALGQEPPPRPAAPSPTATPSPRPSVDPTPTTPATPEPPAVVLPTGDPALPFGTCGSLATTPPAYPLETDILQPEVAAAATSVAAGQSLALTGGFEFVSSYAIAPRTGPVLAVIRDGVVVGTGQLGGDATPAYRGVAAAVFEPGGTSSLPSDLVEYTDAADWLPLAVCDAAGQPDVTPGAPLPAGDYQVVPWAVVVDLGTFDPETAAGTLLPVENAVAAAGATPSTVVGDAVAFTVTGTALEVAPVPGAGGEPALLPDSREPGCGRPGPVPDPAGPLALTLTQAGGTFTPDDITDIEGWLTYDGPGRIGLWTGAMGAYALQDGVVVGSTWLPADGIGHSRLAPGIAARAWSNLHELAACPSDGPVEPLPAGTYDLVVVAFVTPDSEAPSGRTHVASEPVTYVVP